MHVLTLVHNSKLADIIGSEWLQWKLK